MSRSSSSDPSAEIIARHPTPSSAQLETKHTSLPEEEEDANGRHKEPLHNGRPLGIRAVVEGIQRLKLLFIKGKRTAEGICKWEEEKKSHSRGGWPMEVTKTVGNEPGATRREDVGLWKGLLADGHGEEEMETTASG